jgi:hypothetical protein
VAYNESLRILCFELARKDLLDFPCSRVPTRLEFGRRAWSPSVLIGSIRFQGSHLIGYFAICLLHMPALVMARHCSNFCVLRILFCFVSHIPLRIFPSLLCGAHHENGGGRRSIRCAPSNNDTTRIFEWDTSPLVFCLMLFSARLPRRMSLMREKGHCIGRAEAFVRSGFLAQSIYSRAGFGSFNCKHST